MDYFTIAKDIAFERRARQLGTTHYQHPDFASYGACGLPTSNFSADPTCEDCQKQKAAWDRDDDETRVVLGIR